MAKTNTVWSPDTLDSESRCKTVGFLMFFLILLVECLLLPRGLRLELWQAGRGAREGSNTKTRPSESSDLTSRDAREAALGISSPKV